jgi:hypothetical protein
MTASCALALGLRASLAGSFSPNKPVCDTVLQIMRLNRKFFRQNHVSPGKSDRIHFEDCGPNQTDAQMPLIRQLYKSNLMLKIPQEKGPFLAVFKQSWG